MSLLSIRALKMYSTYTATQLVRTGFEIMFIAMPVVYYINHSLGIEFLRIVAIVDLFMALLIGFIALVPTKNMNLCVIVVQCYF